MAFIVDVITPGGVIFKGKPASLLILPASEGEIGIEEAHANLLTLLKAGEMRISESPQGRPERFAVSGGLARAASDHVLVLADAVEPVDKIDVERARRALQRARERLKRAKEEKIDLERAKRARRRARNRIEIAAGQTEK